ncbi:MAG: hypothetical protein ACREMB_13745 [Candidatus Rokuibacteriota bacterium]
MSYSDGTRWLDGPKLVAWLRERAGQRPPTGQEDDLTWARALLGPTFQRQLRQWQRGTKVDLYCLDRWLVRLYLHPAEIPDECWCGPPSRGWSRGKRREVAA